MAEEAYLLDDLLLKIFSYLGHTDLSRAAVVCKQWGVCSDRERSLRCLNFENREIPPEQFEYVCRQCPDAINLNLNGASPLRLLVRKAIPSLRNLVILTLGGGNLDDTFFEALSGFKTLRTLNVVDAALGTDAWMGMSHKRLLTLKLVRCDVMSTTPMWLPMLTVLKLDSCNGKSSDFMDGISRFDKLEVLELDNCSQLPASLVLPRLKHMRLLRCGELAGLTLDAPLLSSMTVYDCPTLESIKLTSNSLQSLRTARFRSSSLQNLSLAGCCKLTILELDCPDLQRLCLDDCRRLESASLCPVGLQSLNTGMCGELSTLVISSPKMEVLELKACRALSVVSIDCPRLKSLDASCCSRLEDESLAATAASCPQIETLLLMSCESIGSDGLRSLRLLPRLATLDLSYTSLTDLLPVFESCPQLKVLKLLACKRLTDSSLEPLYRQGALPLLQELDLSYCSIRLACESLQVESMDMRTEQTLTLNCVSCTNIRKVLIPPPPAHCFVNLSSLNLSMSANLNEVDISCVTLRFLNLRICPSLTKLKLNCPSLISLLLASCNIDGETLEAAVSRCAVLETLNILLCPKILPASKERLRTMYPGLKVITHSLQPPRLNRSSSIQRHMRVWS